MLIAWSSAWVGDCGPGCGRDFAGAEGAEGVEGGPPVASGVPVAAAGRAAVVGGGTG